MFYKEVQISALLGTITGTKLDRLGVKLDKQVAVADLVLTSFLFKLTSTNYLDSYRCYVLLSNLVTGMVHNVVCHLRSIQLFISHHQPSLASFGYKMKGLLISVKLFLFVGIFM